MDRYCETCLHWRRADDGLESEGLCRRYAPRPNLVVLDQVKVMAASWPVTLRSDWCGEWAHRPVPQQRECEECARLQQLIQGLTDRVAAQSELLTRRAEKPEVQP